MFDSDQFVQIAQADLSPRQAQTSLGKTRSIECLILISLCGLRKLI